MLKNPGAEATVTPSPHLEGVDLPHSLKERLQRLIASPSLAHLWVFVAPCTEAATEVARAFLLDWLGVPGETQMHPDLLELKASGKIGLHSIASIRHMLEQLSLSPHGSKGRAVLIDAADRMLPSTANALLKALEEPPLSTVIVLTSSSPHLILPTILSRAQTIRLPGVREPALEELSPLIELLHRGTPVAYSSLMKACEIIQKGFEKEQSQFAKLLGEKRMEDGSELTAGAKQEIAAEAEAGLTLWSQTRSKQLLEDLYLSLRDHQFQGHSCDSAKLTQLLLQALNGIDRGADLSSMLLWFVSQV